MKRTNKLQYSLRSLNLSKKNHIYQHLKRPLVKLIIPPTTLKRVCRTVWIINLNSSENNKRLNYCTEKTHLNVIMVNSKKYSPLLKIKNTSF